MLITTPLEHVGDFLAGPKTALFPLFPAFFQALTDKTE